MTTLADRGGAPLQRLHCAPHPARDYLPIELAMRDMRSAHGRDPETGEGPGSRSWIGVCLGMIVLDTLSGTSAPAGRRFKRLLIEHGVDHDDATVLWIIRNSLLHGYGLPRPSDVRHRRVEVTGATDAFALDTGDARVVRLSAPVFCSHLVERIAASVPHRWDTSLIHTHDALRDAGVRYLPPAGRGDHSG
ncbi:hypothetical protein [Amycolatopsis sp. NPDC051903]|uniref:hypothetical protein n=1 Tax=Amycolatopsis sp. NPDC051903 TaxID=3363936 RepID=UPI00379DB1DD